MDPIDLNAVLSNLEGLCTEATGVFARAGTADEVEQARILYLGQKHGRIEPFEAFFKSLPAEGKKAFGKRFNEVKQLLKQAHVEAKARVAMGATPVGAPQNAQPSSSVPSDKGDFDFSLPGIRPKIGRKHPLTQTAEELIDIFGRFGFRLATGPEIEDEWHNFEALNIPPAHPARDPVENFYLDDATLLRSQTSTVQ